MIIVDDQLLLSILAGQESDSLLSAVERRGDDHVLVLSTQPRDSRRRRHRSPEPTILALSAPHQAEVIGLVDELPEDIITLDSRTVVPVMSALSSVAPANVLTTEAVATALVLDADIAVSVQSELLQRTSDAAQVRVVLFD